MPVGNLHKLHNPTKGSKYVAGDYVGSFEVIEVLGFTDYHPVKKSHMSKKQWWYRVRCSCGSYEVIAQGQLIRRKDCNDCATDRKVRSLRPLRPEPIPAHLDFARIQLVKPAESGPEPTLDWAKFEVLNDE